MFSLRTIYDSVAAGRGAVGRAAGTDAAAPPAAPSTCQRWGQRRGSSHWLLPGALRSGAAKRSRGTADAAAVASMLPPAKDWVVGHGGALPPPRSFAPLISTYVAAFYTGVVAAAVTEQLYKEKYWEDHLGEAVPIMPPKFYWGPWRVMNGEVPRFIQQPDEAKAA